MARPGTTPGTTPGAPEVPPPTRQQLDDLDALLQRMLQLPVSPAGDEDPEEEAAAPELAMRLEPPAQPPQLPPVEPPPGNLVLADPMAPRPAPPPAPPPPPRAVTGPARVAVPKTASVSAATPEWTVPESPVIRHEPPRWHVPASPSAVAVPVPSPPQPVPAVLWPLVAVNRAFDRASFLLGPLGRALRRPAGRSMLGLVGLGLLGTAAGLVVLARFGWTWPR